MLGGEAILNPRNNFDHNHCDRRHRLSIMSSQLITTALLGLNQSHLNPASIMMKAANQEPIKILGALVLRITGYAENDLPQTTRQIVYITDSTDKFFLSMEACRDLGIIPSTFPSIGSTITESSGLEDEHLSDNEDVCNCPTRQKPPPLPTNCKQ